MPRGARKDKAIPWGKSQSDEGTVLMEAIKSLDVDAVDIAIDSFNDKEVINTSRLYKTHTKSKEEEDAHDEALPPLHVLAETEIKQERSDKDKITTIAKALLDAGVDPAIRGNYMAAPFFAVHLGAAETARAILHHLKNVQQKNVTGGPGSIGATRQNGLYGGHGTDVLYAAAKQSENQEMLPMVYEILKDELGDNTTADCKRALGRLLEAACTFQTVSNVTFLLEKGASPEGIHFDKKEDWCDWQRPLHTACNQGNPDIVQTLLDAGASIQTRTVNGLPRPGGPIHFAVAYKYGEKTNAEIIDRRLETVRRLLEAGCDINQPSIMERKTPLEIAIQTGACDVIRFLIVEALCDTTNKDYEFMARKHKKKAVARAYERSVQERDENGGTPRVVRLRGEEEEGGNTGETTMLEFPLGGDTWSWDGERDMIPAGVEFHPILGLFHGEEHLNELKEVHGTGNSQVVSLEDDDDGDTSGSESQQALSLAQQLANALKDEKLQSETDSPWHPFWMLASASSSDDAKAPKRSSPRPSRRRRGGPAPEEVVRPLVEKIFGDCSADKITLQVTDLSQLHDALEVGKRSPAVKAFRSALQRVGVDKVIRVVVNGLVVFPTMVGCILGQEHPSFVGVYATRVET